MPQLPVHAQPAAVLTERTSLLAELLASLLDPVTARRSYPDGKFPRASSSGTRTIRVGGRGESVSSVSGAGDISP